MTLYKVVRSGVKTLVLGVALAAGPATAADRPVVVELFTSQSCYSCPPAEELLGKLAARPGLIALEFHVDYWNSLVYGLAGRWTDVFSSPAHTERQRAYAARLPGGVYTPQMVIDGRAQVVGSRLRDVEQAIAAARSAPDPGAEVSVERIGERLAVRIAGAASTQPTPVWLIRYRERATTRVAAGENRGKTLTNHHVVVRMDQIGIHTGDKTELTAAIDLSMGEGCAVLVQSAALGPIAGAADCQLRP